MNSLFRVDPSTPPEMVATFRNGGRPYAIQALLIQEIVRQDTFAPVDNADDYIVGILNLRGKIVTVIDLGCRLGEEPATETEGKSVLVIPYAEEHLGLLVDEMDDVVSIDPHKIGPVPSNVDPAAAQYFQGIIKMEEEMVTILEPTTILLPEAESAEKS